MYYTLRQVTAAMRAFRAEVEPASAGAAVSAGAYVIHRGDRFATLPAVAGPEELVSAAAIGAACRRLKIVEDIFYAVLLNPLDAEALAAPHVDNGAEGFTN